MRTTSILGIFWVILQFLVCGFAAGRAPSESRPDDGIHDPGGIISAPGRHSLIRAMRTITESSGLDVLVAVVAPADAGDPGELAGELANRWGYYGGRALVLWVPGSDDNPTIAVSGLIRTQLPTADLEAIIGRAKRRGKNYPNADEAILACVESLGEELRFLAGKAARGTETKAAGPVRLNGKEILYLLFMQSKQLLILGGIVVFGIAFIGFVLWKMWRKFRTSLVPKTFPNLSWKPRFGAPHAGIVYTHRNRKSSPSHDHQIPR